MLLWWDVFIGISHTVKVKTYFRNNIYFRDIYYISLRPHLFYICSLAELLIRICLFFSSNLFFKILKGWLFKGRGEIVKFVCCPRICFAFHRNLLECTWVHFKILLEGAKLLFWRCFLLVLLYFFNTVQFGFNWTAWKMVIRTAHQRLILDVKKPVEVPIET